MHMPEESTGWQPHRNVQEEQKNNVEGLSRERWNSKPTSNAKSRKSNLLFVKVEVKPQKQRRRSFLTKRIESLGEIGWIPKVSQASPPRGALQHDNLLRLKVVFDTPSRPTVFVACRGPKSVEQVIEKALLMHKKSGNLPKLPVELNEYELRMIDNDDEVDEDLPALQRYRDVHSYNLLSVGLCRKKLSRSSSKSIQRGEDAWQKIAPGCLPLNIKIHKTKACHTFGVVPETSVDEVLSMLNALKREYDFSKENYAFNSDTFNTETIEWGTKVRDLKVKTLEIRALPGAIEMEVYKDVQARRKGKIVKSEYKLNGLLQTFLN